LYPSLYRTDRMESTRNAARRPIGRLAQSTFCWSQPAQYRSIRRIAQHWSCKSQELDLIVRPMGPLPWLACPGSSVDRAPCWSQGSSPVRLRLGAPSQPDLLGDMTGLRAPLRGARRPCQCPSSRITPASSLFRRLRRSYSLTTTETKTKTAPKTVIASPNRPPGKGAGNGSKVPGIELRRRQIEPKQATKLREHRVHGLPHPQGPGRHRAESSAVDNLYRERPLANEV
jgi:hypothetical protein